MTSDFRDTWDTYASAWAATTLSARRTALEASADPACVYRDPLTCTAGFEPLLAYMEAFQAQVPGGHFTVVYFQAHHDRSVARWHMRDGKGDIIGEGISHGEYGPLGRLVAMTGFFEVPGT